MAFMKSLGFLRPLLWIFWHAVRLCSMLLLIAISASCNQNGISQLMGFSFGGISSIIENADGSYVLSWPPASQAIGVSYNVYQLDLTNPDAFPDGVTPSPVLAEHQKPLISGSLLTTVTTTSFVLPAGSIAPGQAKAFSVVASSIESMQGDGLVMVVKRPNVPILRLVDGNMQNILPMSDSKELVVQLSAGNTPSVGQRIWYEVVRGDVTLNEETAVTKFDGRASITVKANRAPGIAIVAANWGTKQRVEFTVLVVGAAATTKAEIVKNLVVISGNNQRTVPGTEFSNPLRVQATESGTPVTDALVTFSVTSGPSGTLSSVTAKTDSTGIASVNYTPIGLGKLFILGNWEGQNATFELLVANETLDFVSGSNQSAETGTAFPNPLQARLMRNGVPVAGEPVTLSKVAGV